MMEDYFRSINFEGEDRKLLQAPVPKQETHKRGRPKKPQNEEDRCKTCGTFWGVKEWI